MNDENNPAAVLQAFIPQYYLDKQVPSELIVSHKPDEIDLLAEVLSNKAQHAVTISANVRGERLKWLQMALTNAENALSSKVSEKLGLSSRLVDLQALLKLDGLPNRMECFDISHTQGDQTVASCVVFDRDGPLKSAYRRFNIQGVIPGDDYAAIYQAVNRRFKRSITGKLGNSEEISKDQETLTKPNFPDVLFIDGGKGQLRAARKALTELNINNVMIVGISKGPDRKPGMEKLIAENQEQPLNFPVGSGGLLLIQHIRDEAHRFAITGHRQRRGKLKKQSVLESIPGLGAKRRQILLKQFGGLQGVSQAGVDALGNIDGISKQLAQRIYEHFHHHDDN